MRFVPADLEIRAGDAAMGAEREVPGESPDRRRRGRSRCTRGIADVLTPDAPWRHRFDAPGEYHYRSLVHT